MARETIAIDVGAHAELARLAHEVAESGARRLLTENGATLAIVTPIGAQPRRSRRPQPLTRDNPSWETVGSITAAVGSDTSEHTHLYLAEAYAADAL